MALSLSHLASPRGLSKEALKNNPTWVAMVRVYTHTEAHARESVALATELVQRLHASEFPIRKVVFAVWKGNKVSVVPGDTGYFAPLFIAEMKSRRFPLEVELSDVECYDPYGSLLNLGVTYAAHRGADYFLSLSLQTVDYLDTAVAEGFIEAARAGAYAAGVKMNEVTDLIGPSNRLALWAVGPLSAARGFATGVDVLGGTSSTQEQTVALINMRRQYGRACVSMVEPGGQGRYRVPLSHEGKQVHDKVQDTLKQQQAMWLGHTGASADELQAAILQ